jgi:hypothetical protein
MTDDKFGVSRARFPWRPEQFVEFDEIREKRNVLPRYAAELPSPDAISPWRYLIKFIITEACRICHLSSVICDGVSTSWLDFTTVTWVPVVSPGGGLTTS